MSEFYFRRTTLVSTWKPLNKVKDIRKLSTIAKEKKCELERNTVYGKVKPDSL